MLLEELVRSIKPPLGVIVIFFGGILGLTAWASSTNNNSVFVVLLSFIVFILPTLVLLSWNLTRHAVQDNQTPKNQHDRKYKLISSEWWHSFCGDYTALQSKNQSIRDIVCLAGNIPILEISVTPLDPVVLLDPTYNYDVILSESSTYKKYNGDPGIITVGRMIGNYGHGFKLYIPILFNPPMNPGDEAHVDVSFVIPRYKAATYEALAPRNIGPRDYEFSSIPIEYETERLILKNHFAPECKILPLNPMVIKNEEPLINEVSELIKNREYQLQGQKKIGFSLSFDITNPKIGRKYRICWKPPSESELQTQ